jgi:DNA-binding transcriptional MocR family regulator
MEVISLDCEAPGSDLLPLEELVDCAGAAVAGDGRTLLSYGTGAGYTPLRELIGEWFGVPPQRVLVTNGRLQGVGLLAERLVRGRNVVTESPGDDRTDRVLLAAGGALAPVGVDGDGLRIDELRQLLIQYTRPVLVSVTPSFQNPTGATMSQARRTALLELVEEQNRMQTERLVVLEDDSFALTRFDGERVPALFDLSGGTTVYSCSFSPTVAPGLRVGFFILPPDLAAELTGTANATYISPALPAQATVYEFIRRGSLAPHLDGLCAALRERRDAMDVALTEHFVGASWEVPDGGFFVWLELPSGVDGRAVLARAEGVTAVAGTRFGWTANALRLSFCGAAPDEIAAGVARLAAAMP